MLFGFNFKKKLYQVHLYSLHHLAQQRNRAYMYGVVLTGCCLLLSAAVMVLAQRHTVVPVIAVVDAQGHVVKQDRVTADKMMADERVIQSEIYNFITNCNTFDLTWRQHYADLCRLHAAKNVAEQYTREISQESTDNPYQQLAKNSRIYPKITGIHAIEDHGYQVAYQLITEQTGSIVNTQYYRAFIKYRFTAQPLSLGDRWENALGFAVTAYRKAPELNTLSR